MTTAFDERAFKKTKEGCWEGASEEPLAACHSAPAMSAEWQEAGGHFTLEPAAAANIHGSAIEVNVCVYQGRKEGEGDMHILCLC